ncbi:PEGA domain-containing protein [bacterium]|nr:PEGA domain-containing protein [bacterium]
MHTHRTLVSVGFALLLVLTGMLPESLRADTVALQPLYLEEAPDSLQSAWVQIFSEEAAKADLQVAKTEDVQRAVSNVGDDDPYCLTPTCMQAVAKSVGADYAVAGQVNGSVSRYVFELWVVAADQPLIRHRVSRESKPEPKDVRPMMKELALELVELLRYGQGVLAITTEPDAGRVEVNGTSVGIAPLQLVRPGERRYEVKALRPGYKTRSRNVFLAENDTQYVHLKMSEKPYTDPMEIPSLRGWVTAGLPLYQPSSALDTDISWGSGSTLGVHVEMGNLWRVRFSLYNYQGDVEEVEANVGSRFVQSHTPRGRALVLAPSLVYASRTKGITPFLNAGLVWMQREVELDLADGGTERRRTTFLPGYLFGLGLEWPLYGPIAMQLDLQYAATFERGDTYKQDGEQIAPVWDRAFETFRDFTVVRLGIGYRL